MNRRDSALKPGRAPRTAPGPRRLAVPWTLLGLRRDMVGTLLKASRRYGDVVSIPAGGLQALLVVAPDDIRYVLHDRWASYPGNTSPAGIAHLLGEGLALIEGKRWQRHRRLMQPAFHRQRVDGLLAFMSGPTAAMLERWGRLAASGRPLDLVAELRRLTMEISVLAMFGAEFQASEAFADAWFAVTDDLRRGRLARRWQRFRGRNQPDPSTALKCLDKAVYRVIAERRASGKDHFDLLSMLLQSRDKDGQGFNDREVRDEVMNIFYGAYDTTANALVWAWLLLARHPRAERRLSEEARGTLGEGRPSLKDLPKLSYTSQVFEETLRLHPAAPLFGRTALEEDQIGGFAVPAGAKIVISPYITHRHQDFWPDPEAFEPERFARRESEARHRYAYFPFGRGPRQCIGQQFGWMEAQVVLGMVASRYRIRPLNRPDWLRRHGVRPRAGLWARLVSPA